MTLPKRPLSLTVNGKPVGPIDVPDDMMLLDVLHEYLGLTGSRMACGQGICHACAVILDGPAGPLPLLAIWTITSPWAGSIKSKSVMTRSGRR